jgi:hypothetical protein
MTTPSTERKAGPLLGTGAQTSWPFTFKVFAESDIGVTIADSLGVETALVLDTDYSVALNANQETSPGGTVVYPISGSPLPVGSRLVIFGNLPYDQPLDLPSGGNFSPLALENELDRLTMQIQQLREQVGRSLQVSVTTGANVRLPAPSANELIGWDSTAQNLQNFALSELATAVAYATMRYDTFTGDGIETQFTLTADPVTLANLDVAISGVTQVPGSDYSLVDGVLVFVSAPANGTEILARYGEGLVNVGGDSNDIRFLQAGAGAVQRTVQAKLREVISVTDFGADATGATDSSLAIQSAVDVLPASGGQIKFPTGVYLFKDIDILDKESVSFDFGDSVLNVAAGAQYAFKMENTSSNFKKGGTWENATFGSGSASVGLIWIEGGAWTNQVFNRINNNSASAPALFYYSNSTIPLRNPSNFTFTQIFDRSFGCKYLFHYDAAATTTNFDNFVMKNILHYGNQDGCAVIYFDGAAALYSTFENIYGGMYANNARLVKMNGAIAASRNTWKNFLMEGAGNNRICMDGYYNESTISTVVNYIDESTYIGNQALYAILTSSTVDHLLVQDAATGSYSTNTAVTLMAGSGVNKIFEIGVLADSGYKNTVYRGKGDYVLAAKAKQSITSNGSYTLFTLPPNEFEVGDTFKIFVGGISSGLYKDLSLVELGDRSLYAITGGLLTESWSFELTYYVFLSGGNKNLSCYLKAYKGNTLQYAEYLGDRTFTSNITWALSASAASWAGTAFVMQNAYAAPMYNHN